MLKSLPLLLGLALVAGTAQAGSDARWFRYLDDRKQPVVTDTVTPEHITHGYDELNARMQLLRHVDARPPLTPEQIAAQKAKVAQAAQRARDDRQLQRLYAGPSDAERARNRQLEATQSRLEIASKALANLRQRRAAEAQKAASLERTGKPVPADLKATIATYDQQIAANQAEITSRTAELKKVNDDFEPMIQRLAELTGKPAGTVPLPAGIVIPGAAPAPSGTPPAATAPAPAPAAK